jgi:hypothetical protein
MATQTFTWDRGSHIRAIHDRDRVGVRLACAAGTVGGCVIRRALAVAVAVMLVVPVLAEARVARPKQQDDRVPSAQVEAAGTGLMTIIGRMVVNGTIPEQGAVTIADRARDARAYLAGKPLKFNNRGRVTVRRATGILFVTGSNVQVHAPRGPYVRSPLWPGASSAPAPTANSGERCPSPAWIRAHPPPTLARRNQECAHARRRP